MGESPALYDKVRTILTAEIPNAREIIQRIIKQARDGHTFTNSEIDAYVTQLSVGPVDAKTMKGWAELIWGYLRGKPPQAVSFTKEKRSLEDILTGENPDGGA